MPRTTREIIDKLTQDRATKFNVDVSVLWFSQSEVDDEKEKWLKDELFSIDKDFKNWVSIDKFKTDRPYLYNWLIGNGFVYSEELDKWQHSREKDFELLRQKLKERFNNYAGLTSSDSVIDSVFDEVLK